MCFVSSAINVFVCFCFYSTDGSRMKEVTFELLDHEADILTFAVYARDFGRDSIIESSATRTVTAGLMILSSILFNMLW